jgi:cell wall-associated NlpC family hydrolase
MTYVMTAKSFVEKAVHIANDLATVYTWGGYGLYHMDKWGFDCSGLVKGILWGFDDKPFKSGGAVYGANHVPDLNALQIRESCVCYSEDFSTITPGEFLYRQSGESPEEQHCGIYVGNGLAVEATAQWDCCVQVSTVENLVSGEAKAKYWMGHGKLPWIDYAEPHNGWILEGCKSYWYESGVKQGTAADPKCVKDGHGVERGREIYDPDTDAWYWLDANDNGARAANKDVWIPYIHQDEEPGSTNGKWVRYDENGKMIKGWNCNEGTIWYFDQETGAMTKGDLVINSIRFSFDPATGVLKSISMREEV